MAKKNEVTFAEPVDDFEADLPPADEPVSFEGHDPVPGLEALGRAIVDAHGQPSGSPANYEVLRGQTGVEVLPPDESVVAALQDEFGV